MIERKYYTYDLETYPNIFTFAGKFRCSDEFQLFEISDRKDQTQELLNWLSYLSNSSAEMMGFNNLGFDYFIIHELMTNPYTFNYSKAFQLAQTIIASQNKGFGGFKTIGYSNRLIPQIDWYKICHFDNKAKTTSLKALQFAMRSHSLEDLPFDIRPLDNQEKDTLCKYNLHDVTETEKFGIKNQPLLDMRREYLDNGILFGDVLNYNDTKIGAEYFISKLGRGKCYSGGKPRQTIREIIEFSRIILPKIKFRTDVFNEVLSWFMQQRVYVVKNERLKLESNLAGLPFHFGLGGVHASADNKIFHTTETHQIVDIDVTGMYPAVAIANGFAPAHLGDSFTTAYKQIVNDRANYPKGSSQNAVLKLASNGVYGKSNSVYSPFYDPQYTFSITVNGQLQILQLVEMIDLLPDCELIQANTDGITVRLNNKYKYLFDIWCKEWENMTDLKLEEVLYNRMWIRDVNNYIAETMDGKLKRKGTYWYPLNEKEYEGWWNKDFSNLASKKAAEKAMTHSWSVSTAIRLICNPFDFMLRYKATGKSKLFIGDVQQLKTVRYYVSISGEPMKKVSPPKGEIGQYKRANKIKDEYFDQIMKEIGKDVWSEKIHTNNKSKYGIVETSVQAGWKVKQCNVASDFDWKDVDWSYYVQEAEKILIGNK